MTKVRPLNDRVLIKRVEAEQKTASGLFIPEAAKEKPMEGEVVAVGTGRRSDDGNAHEMTLKVGDRILFGKYTGDEVKLDGEELLILNESEIFGVLEG